MEHRREYLTIRLGKYLDLTKEVGKSSWKVPRRRRRRACDASDVAGIHGQLLTIKWAIQPNKHTLVCHPS